MARTVSWPPEVLHVTPLGYIRDVTGNYYPRDIGRSTQLSNGQVVFQFGDTFCHNFKKNYVGISNNNCAVVSGSPTVTEFLTPFGSGRFDGETAISNLVPRHHDESDTTAFKYKIWSFSGIVEKQSSHGRVCGWTFLETFRDQLQGGPNDVYQHTSISEVTIDGMNVFASKSTKTFYNNEPRFGSFCAIGEGSMLLAYGHTGHNKDIVLAKVPIEYAADRNQYSYWNGSNWSSSSTQLAPVIRDMQHGQIFKTAMFGPDSPFQYAFIGCNARGDSTIQMGRAAAPQGPWEIFPLKIKTYITNDPKMAGPFRYCMYPQPWACDISKGDLMITWSEGGMTGGVLAVQARLKTT